MFYSIITTIQPPTRSVCNLVEHLAKIGGKLVVAGDSKGPDEYNPPDARLWPVEFLSLAAQLSSAIGLAKELPIKHYSRKNIAYLHAIREGASCIYETDDDNTPSCNWHARGENVTNGRLLDRTESTRWVNVYRYFSEENIWPRGLPLDEIRKFQPGTREMTQPLRAPVQQGLVNGSADVDAIWRLVMDREFNFNESPCVYLEPGNWCPFNTQTTWWWPVAFPLLYIPSFCSFRMCDIWKSFVAQRCLWAMGMGVVFHPPEVVQDRNPHDLMRDFIDEIPGYEHNRRIAMILDKLELIPGEDAVCANLRACYAALIDGDMFPKEEIRLVDAWLAEFS